MRIWISATLVGVLCTGTATAQEKSEAQRVADLVEMLRDSDGDQHERILREVADMALFLTGRAARALLEDALHRTGRSQSYQHHRAVLRLHIATTLADAEDPEGEALSLFQADADRYLKSGRQDALVTRYTLAAEGVGDARIEEDVRKFAPLAGIAVAQWAAHHGELDHGWDEGVTGLLAGLPVGEDLEELHALTRVLVQTRSLGKRPRFLACLHGLFSPHQLDQIAAIRVLPTLPNPERTVVILCELTSREDQLVAREAITALGMIGPPAKHSLPTLEKLTEHPDPQIRERAKAALREIR